MFPAAMSALNVETPVPKDMYVLPGSIPGLTYRVTSRIRVYRTFRAVTEVLYYV